MQFTTICKGFLTNLSEIIVLKCLPLTEEKLHRISNVKGFHDYYIIFLTKCYMLYITEKTI